MDGAFGVGLSSFTEIMAIFARPPMLYFTAIGLVGGIAGVAKIFAPMRRR